MIFTKAKIKNKSIMMAAVMLLGSCSFLPGSPDYRKSHVYFYGKVVDQHGKPVPHAKVYFGVSRHGFVGNSNGYFYDIITDADGKFAIEGIEGHSLNFKNVEKTGYEYGGGIGSFRGFPRYSGKNAPKSRLWTETSEAKPVVFQMWKKTEAEPLIYNDDARVYPFPNGQFETVNLQGKGESIGDFKVSSVRSGTRSNPGDWKIVIEAIDGGFIESDEVFMNIAPEDGYQRKVVLSYKKGDENYVSRVRKKYYLKSRGGQSYARLDMQIRPFFNDKKSGLRFKYWLNPNGSRNLQYDPKKRIYLK